MLQLFALFASLGALPNTNYNLVLSTGNDAEHGIKQYTMSPAVQKIGPRDFVYCYSRGSSHTNNHDIVLRFSHDNGYSVGPEIPLLPASDPAVSERGCSLSQAPSGRVYVNWNVTFPAATRPPYREVRWTYSDDITSFEFSSWVPAYVSIATGTFFTSQGGSRVLFWDGQCWWGYYDRMRGDQCYNGKLAHTQLVEGTCDEANWVTQTIARDCDWNRGHNGYEYEEVVLCDDPAEIFGDHKIAMARVDRVCPYPEPCEDDHGIYQIDSWDRGRTWSDPRVFDAGGRPECRVLATGQLVVITRAWFDQIDGSVMNRGVIFSSEDEGATWTWIEHQDPLRGTQIYASSIESAPGVLSIISAQEWSNAPGQRSFMYWQMQVIGASLIRRGQAL